MEPPIRIKLYGFNTVTKRGYITQLILAGVLLAGLIGMWVVLRPQIDPSISPGLARIRDYFEYLPWVVLVIGVLYVIEATMVLRRFAREEARRRAQQLAAPPKP